MSNVRTEIKELLDRLLLGPYETTEILSTKPSDVYLTGILWPPDAFYGEEEEDDILERPIQDQEDTTIDKGAPVYNVFKPKSIGITCFIEGTNTPFDILISGARYNTRISTEKENIDKENKQWKRQPINYTIRVNGNETKKIWKEHFILPSGKTDDSITVHIKRRIKEKGLDITVTLINTSNYETKTQDENCLFQSNIRIDIPKDSDARIIARKDSDVYYNDEDSNINNLLYRNLKEYAVGHGIAAVWDDESLQGVRSVYTSWLPEHVLSTISPDGHPTMDILKNLVPFPLSAEYLASKEKRKEITGALSMFCDIYEAWIQQMEKEASKQVDFFEEVAKQNLKRCREASDRMKNGITLLRTDNTAWVSFCLANQAMDNQSRSKSHGQNARPLIWRPFQIAFILLTLPSLVDSKDKYRNCLDLLWFPTGGGKTEAYLGLMAFIIFYRRLTNEYSRDHGNVDILTRYTLRLLTIQQFQRASAMICACDQIRISKTKELGTAPISIGLYVGQGSTPNMVFNPKKEISGSIDAFTAIEEEKAGKHPSCTPRQILRCPLCGVDIPPSNYEIDKLKKTVKITCPNKSCESKQNSLPIYTVDEEIYKVLPSLIISTVDKLAQLPRNENIGHLFGLPEGIPPALIIQDELHLISGPLGSMTGLYETTVDLLCRRDGTRPKIIGSTATIGRARNQVKALFDCSVFQFPPSGLDVDDSFFAVKDTSKPDRLYKGICSSGRSQKFTLQAVIAALMQSGQSLLDDGKHSDSEIDPFWTGVIYFNSLRELGGAEVMIHDDVRRSISAYANKLDDKVRELESTEFIELTSRVASNKIPEYLESLKIGLYSEPEKGSPADIVLASNMISVGVDIPRLGLMVVNGQPKSTAEYIQATSRIGRGLHGLIITCLNSARPRDLSHFEHFKQYHSTLYRSVEATSVTPWSSRARDKALHAVFIATVRHLGIDMSGDDDATNFKSSENTVKQITEGIKERAKNSAQEINSSLVNDEIIKIIDYWEHKVRNQEGRTLAYWAKTNPFNRIINYPLLMNAEDARTENNIMPAPNSLREVEPAAYFTLWPTPNNAF